MEFYNDTETFKFATSIESPTDIGTVELQYHMAQVDPSRSLFSIWSVEPSSGKELMIGITDIFMDHPEEGWVTVGLFLIAKDWQRKGIGTKALKMLEHHLRDRFGTRNFRAGMLGHQGAPLAFWLGSGYNATEVEPHYTFIEGVSRDLIWLTKQRGASGTTYKM